MDINEVYLRLASSGRPHELDELLSSARNGGSPELRVDYALPSDGANALIVCARGADMAAVERWRDYGRCVRVLVERRIDVNSSDRLGRTALHWAVQNGALPVVCELLNAGADIGKEDRSGLTPVQYGIRCSQLDALRAIFDDDDRKKIIDYHNTSGWTPLVDAVCTGDIDVCELLLELGADPNVCETCNLRRSPLHHAIYNEQLDIFKLLLQYGASANIPDIHKKCVIHKATYAEDIRYLAAIMETDVDTSTLDVQNDDGASPLMLACQNEEEENVIALLNKGASVYALDNTGKTPLHYCVENSTTRIAELILDESDPDRPLVDIADSEGYTPLQLAIIAANKVFVQFLLHNGADIKCTDSEGHTVIHWATVCGHVNLIDLLQSEGAEISCHDIHHAYPLHYAAQMCGATGEGTDPKTGLDMLSKLLSYNAEVDCCDQDNRTPLLWAASSGSHEACEMLLKHGASTKSTDKDGLTALHCAASRGHLKCVELLVKKSSSVNYEDKNGCTPLFYAITLGHDECAKLLLNKNADPSHKDKKGRTPAHCAAAKGSITGLTLLADKKGDLWQQNLRGEYPVHEAALAKHNDVVKYLLNTCNDKTVIDLGNNDSRTCLHIAALTNNLPLCKELLDRGANRNVVMSNKGRQLTPYDAALLKVNKECAEYLADKGGKAATSMDKEENKENEKAKVEKENNEEHHEEEENDEDKHEKDEQLDEKRGKEVSEGNIEEEANVEKSEAEADTGIAEKEKDEKKDSEKSDEKKASETEEENGKKEADIDEKQEESDEKQEESGEKQEESGEKQEENSEKQEESGEKQMDSVETNATEANKEKKEESVEENIVQENDEKTAAEENVKKTATGEIDVKKEENDEKKASEESREKQEDGEKQKDNDKKGKYEEKNEERGETKPVEESDEKTATEENTTEEKAMEESDEKKEGNDENKSHEDVDEKTNNDENDEKKVKKVNERKLKGEACDPKAKEVDGKKDDEKADHKQVENELDDKGDDAEDVEGKVETEMKKDEMGDKKGDSEEGKEKPKDHQVKETSESDMNEKKAEDEKDRKKNEGKMERTDDNMTKTNTEVEETESKGEDKEDRSSDHIKSDEMKIKDDDEESGKKLKPQENEDGQQKSVEEGDKVKSDISDDSTEVAESDKHRKEDMEETNENKQQQDVKEMNEEENENRNENSEAMKSALVLEEGANTDKEGQSTIRSVKKGNQSQSKKADANDKKKAGQKKAKTKTPKTDSDKTDGKVPAKKSIVDEEESCRNDTNEKEHVTNGESKDSQVAKDDSGQKSQNLKKQTEKDSKKQSLKNQEKLQRHDTKKVGDNADKTDESATKRKPKSDKKMAETKEVQKKEDDAKDHVDEKKEKKGTALKKDDGNVFVSEKGNIQKSGTRQDNKGDKRHDNKSNSTDTAEESRITSGKQQTKKGLVKKPEKKQVHNKENQKSPEKAEHPDMLGKRDIQQKNTEKRAKDDQVLRHSPAKQQTRDNKEKGARNDLTTKRAVKVNMSGSKPATRQSETKLQKNRTSTPIPGHSKKSDKNINPPNHRAGPPKAKHSNTRKEQSPTRIHRLPEDESDSYSDEDEQNEHRKQTRQAKRKKQPRWAEEVESVHPSYDDNRRPHTTPTGRVRSPLRRAKVESKRPQTVPEGSQKVINSRSGGRQLCRPVTHAGTRPTTHGSHRKPRPVSEGRTAEMSREGKRRRELQERIYGKKPEDVHPIQPIRPITRGSRKPKVGIRRYKNEIQEYVRIFELKKLASQQMLKTRKMHLYSIYRGNISEKKLVQNLSTEFIEQTKRNLSIEPEVSDKKKFSKISDFENYLQDELSQVLADEKLLLARKKTFVEESCDTLNSSRISKTNTNSTAGGRCGHGSGSEAGHSTASNSTSTTPRTQRAKPSQVQDPDEDRHKQTEKSYRPILPAGMFHEPQSKSERARKRKHLHGGASPRSSSPGESSDTSLPQISNKPIIAQPNKSYSKDKQESHVHSGNDVNDGHDQFKDNDSDAGES